MPPSSRRHQSALFDLDAPNSVAPHLPPRPSPVVLATAPSWPDVDPLDLLDLDPVCAAAPDHSISAAIPPTPPPPPPLPPLSQILEPLNPAQRRIATTDGPVLGLAGPGTGKTRSLTAAIARRLIEGIPPRRIFATTFTNKAAREMRDRLAALLGDTIHVPSWMGTFHNLSARLLRTFPEAAQLPRDFRIADASEARALIKEAMRRLNIPLVPAEPRAPDPVAQIARRIERWKDEIIPPERADQAAAEAIAALERDAQAYGRILSLADYDAWRQPARAYPVYQELLRETRRADFGDLILWPVLAMLRDDNVRRHWASRYDVVCGDEFQDANTAQACLLTCLARDHSQLLVVADDDQSIFSWRGSDVRFVREFAQCWPAAAVVPLEQNYRSTATIVAAATALIAKDTGRLGKTLWTEAAAGPLIDIVSCASAEAEAAAIVGTMVRFRAQAAIKGTTLPWSSFAALYRINAVSRAIEEALIQRGIPHEVVGDVGFFERLEVKDALAYLDLIDTPHDPRSDLAFRRIVNAPPRGIGDVTVTAIERAAEGTGLSLFDAAHEADLSRRSQQPVSLFRNLVLRLHDSPPRSLSEHLAAILDTMGYLRHLRESREAKAEDRLANLHELIELVGKFRSVAHLMDHLALAAGDLRPPSSPTTTTAASSSPTTPADPNDRVRLMTLHRSKGLEFPIVFLPAWEDTIFPSPRALADGPDSAAEERRLAFVGLTRAKRKVIILHARQRHAAAPPANPTPFIYDLPLHLCRWSPSSPG